MHNDETNPSANESAPASDAAQAAPEGSASLGSGDSKDGAGVEAPAAETAEEPVSKAGQVKEDVVHYCYDNEHEDGVLCTLTFKDGSTASGTAASTGNLADDQALASAAALASVA